MGCRRGLAAAGAAVLLMAPALTGCVLRAPTDAAGPEQPGTSTPEPPPLGTPSDAAQVRDRGASLELGTAAVHWHTLGDEVELSDGGDGSRTLTTTGSLWLAAPEGTTWSVLSDDSVVATAEPGAAAGEDGSASGAEGTGAGGSTPGAVVAALAPAVSVESDADAGRAGLPADVEAVTADLLRLDPLEGTAGVSVSVSATALLGATWGDREGGLSLAVVPTPWARAAGRAGEEAVWSAVVAAEPEADLPTMRDQLTCHVVGAPDKESWNLEPWRPDVGLLKVLAASCNPT